MTNKERELYLGVTLYGAIAKADSYFGYVPLTVLQDNTTKRLCFNVIVIDDESLTMKKALRLGFQGLPEEKRYGRFSLELVGSRAIVRASLRGHKRRRVVCLIPKTRKLLVERAYNIGQEVVRRLS